MRSHEVLPDRRTLPYVSYYLPHHDLASDHCRLRAEPKRPVWYPVHQHMSAHRMGRRLVVPRSREMAIPASDVRSATVSETSLASAPNNVSTRKRI